jgi:hypothetical protein
MKGLHILGFISILVSLLFNSAEAVEPATTQVSKLCEVQAGGYDLDQYDSGAQQYEQAISCNLSVADASSEGNASAGFGPGIPKIGIVKANAQIDTYNGIAKANLAASVQYYFEIQKIKVVPSTPPALLPVLFSARGEGHSQRVGYGLSQSIGVVYIFGFYDKRFEFEAYVVDEVAYDQIDEEYIEGGFNDTKFLNLSPNYPYSVSMSAGCSLWAGPVGQNAHASVRCSAQVDPFIAFDQSAFDAVMGNQTFALNEHYRIVFSENLPLPPSPTSAMPWIPLLLLND